MKIQPGFKGWIFLGKNNVVPKFVYVEIPESHDEIDSIELTKEFVSYDIPYKIGLELNGLIERILKEIKIKIEDLNKQLEKRRSEQWEIESEIEKYENMREGLL